MVNLGGFEETEWGEPIYYLPLQCKGKKNSVKHNNPGLNRLFFPSLTKTGTSAEPAGLPSCKQENACPPPPCRLIRLQPIYEGGSAPCNPLRRSSPFPTLTSPRSRDRAGSLMLTSLRSNPHARTTRRPAQAGTSFPSSLPNSWMVSKGLRVQIGPFCTQPLFLVGD